MIHALPPLPYAAGALAPKMSQETIEYHYGKHHQAYVNNLNNLIPGTPYENASLEEIIIRAEGPISTMQPKSGTTPSSSTPYLLLQNRCQADRWPRLSIEISDPSSSSRSSLQRPPPRFSVRDGYGSLPTTLGSSRSFPNPMPAIRFVKASVRCWRSMSGNTPTTSTTATAGPILFTTSGI